MNNDSANNPTPAAGISGFEPLRPGEQVGSYTIVEQIGAGGSSVVWKCRDHVLDRVVAIKQLLLDAGQDDLQPLRERFASEAEIHKTLGDKCKHLIRLIDFIDDPRGLFIVMEYVEGLSLQQLLATQKDPLAPRQALGIMAAAAVALQAMHKQGMIHRDLKPSNILLPKAGGLKVCDYGQASLIEHQDAMSIGTVRYMAPELFNDSPADGRADLYSLGMMAYEMLAGREQYEQAFKFVLRDQRNQALRWMKWHTNPRTRAAPLISLNPDIPQTLSDLVSRLLEKDPAKRVASADELIHAIGRHFAGQGAADESNMDVHTPAMAQQPAEQAAVIDPTAALPKRRGRARQIAVALVIVLTIGGVGAWVWSSQAGRAQVQQALAEHRRLYDQAREAFEAGEFAQARDQFANLAGMDIGHPQVRQAAQARSLLAQGMLAMQDQRYDHALGLFQQAEQINVLEQELVGGMIREASSRASFAREVSLIENALQRGEFDEARRRLRDQRTYQLTAEEEQQLSELGARLEDQTNQRQIALVLQRAEELIAASRGEEALVLLQQAYHRFGASQLRQRSLEVQQAMTYQQALGQARQHEQAGRLVQALESYNRALAIRSSPELQQRITYLRGQTAYQQGVQLERDGNTSAALAAYTQALGYGDHAAAREAIARLQVSGQQSGFVRAGDQAMSGGEPQAAIQHYQNALALGDDPSVRQKLANARLRATTAQARLLIEQQQLDEARDLLERTQQSAGNDPEISSLLAYVRQREQYMRHLQAGDQARSQSQFGQAKLAYRRAREIDDTREVRQRQEDTEYEHLIAQARDYMQAENWPSARAMLRAAAEMRSTDVVRQLLDEVNRNDPSGNGA